MQTPQQKKSQLIKLQLNEGDIGTLLLNGKVDIRIQFFRLCEKGFPKRSSKGRALQM